MPFEMDSTISIHAPREGGDIQFVKGVFTGDWISIHAPREGGDFGRCDTTNLLPIFQSTPPARGATGAGPDRGGQAGISIHAPREGGDIVFRHLA